MYPLLVTFMDWFSGYFEEMVCRYTLKGSAENLVFSADNTKLIGWTKEYGDVNVWDLRSGKVIKILHLRCRRWRENGSYTQWRANCLQLSAVLDSPSSPKRLNAFYDRPRVRASWFYRSINVIGANNNTKMVGSGTVQSDKILTIEGYNARFSLMAKAKTCSSGIPKLALPASCTVKTSCPIVRSRSLTCRGNCSSAYSRAIG